MRRLACLLGLIYLLFFVALTAVVQPTRVFAEGSDQSVTATVPCTVTLRIGDYGSVTVNGKSYEGSTSFTALLGTKLTYEVMPNKGYMASVVTYNGMDVTDALEGGSYVAAPLDGNVTFSIGFVERPVLQDASQADSVSQTDARSVATSESVNSGVVTNHSFGSGETESNAAPTTTARTSDANPPYSVCVLACLMGIACILVAVTVRENQPALY